MKIDIILLLIFLSVMSMPYTLAVRVSPPDPSQVDYLVPGYDRLPFKDQVATASWVNYVNNNLNPSDTWTTVGSQTKIALKCLSYSASTVNDWFLINTGGGLKNEKC